ncbi:MAG: hypothetical protein AAFN11_13760 [Chloroflexota bacterium]
MRIQYSLEVIKTTLIDKTVRVTLHDGTTCKQIELTFNLLDNPDTFVNRNLKKLFASADVVADGNCAEFTQPEPPAPAGLQWIINKRVANSIDTVAIEVYLSNGQTARRIERIRPADEDHAALIEANKNALWQRATPFDMQLANAANQRVIDPLINRTIHAIFSVFASSAEPDPVVLMGAAADVLRGTPKMREWNKLNQMMQEMTPQQLNRFIALMIVINLTKSARN